MGCCFHHTSQVPYYSLALLKLYLGPVQNTAYASLLFIKKKYTMKQLLMGAMLLTIATVAFSQKQVSAAYILSRLASGEALICQDAVITDDIDFTRFPLQTVTGQYPEKGKTVYVVSNFINGHVYFKNCVFKGRLNFFRAENTAGTKKEYRVEWREDVLFENCRFEKAVDFELTNFTKLVSLERSVFTEQPRFVRMGLRQKPQLNGLTLQKGCYFQFDQSKKVKTQPGKYLMNVDTSNHALPAGWK